MREHPHRDGVGVVGRDGDQSVVVGRVGGEPVLGQAGEPLRRDPDAADVVAGELAELLVELVSRSRIAEIRDRVSSSRSTPDRRKSLRTFSSSRAAAASSPSSVEAGEDVVERAVEAPLRRQLVGVLLGGLGDVPHALVGVHVAEQRSRGRDTAEVAGRRGPRPAAPRRARPAGSLRSRSTRVARPVELLGGPGPDPVAPGGRRRRWRAGRGVRGSRSPTLGRTD